MLKVEFLRSADRRAVRVTARLRSGADRYHLRAMATGENADESGRVGPSDLPSDLPSAAAAAEVVAADRVIEANLAAHRAAIDTGAPAYVDHETGYLVMTERTLADRGSCCGSGCRHCPYPPDEQARAGRPAS